MFSHKNEAETKKLTFYIVYTCIYFPIILLTLYYSNGFYSVGNYDFRTVLLVIVVAETAKYFVGALRWKKTDTNLFRKHDSSSLLSFLTRSKLKDGFKNIFIVCFMIMVYFVVSVLYGAEVFTKHEETLMFSSLLSVLTVFPICVNLGSTSLISVLLGCKPNDKMESLMYQNVYLTLLGAWLGAFVIPLDWDRPWQKWPIPCSCGAMIGFLISHLLMIFQIQYPSLKLKH